MHHLTLIHANLKAHIRVQATWQMECFKEYFCFRVPLLNLQPAFVAALWFTWVFEGGWISRILSLIVGGLLLILAVQKWRMPLHFDIGDKTKYQI